MKILNQYGDGIVFTEGVRDIVILLDTYSDEVHKGRYLVKADLHQCDAIPLARYTTKEKAKRVIEHIFEHKGGTFVMPRDEEVETQDDA